ncbi:hypothetical protein [Paraburkholderia sp. A1RO-5L]
MAFAEIKALFYRANRTSPDRIVHPPKMDDVENLRFAPCYHERAWRPVPG